MRVAHIADHIRCDGSESLTVLLLLRTLAFWESSRNVLIGLSSLAVVRVLRGGYKSIDLELCDR